MKDIFFSWRLLLLLALLVFGRFAARPPRTGIAGSAATPATRSTPAAQAGVSVGRGQTIFQSSSQAGSGGHFPDSFSRPTVLQ